MTGKGHLYLSINKAELDSLAITAIVYAILGFLAFFIGYESRIGAKAVRICSYPPPKWNQKLVKVVILAYTLIGLIASIIYLNSNGGLIFYITHINWFRGNSLNIQNAYLQWGFKLFPIASYLLLLNGFNSSRNSLISKLMTFIYILGSMLSLLIIGGRSSVVSYFLIIILLYHYCKHTIKFSRLLIAGVLVIVFVVVIGQIRGQMLSVPDQYVYSIDKNKITGISFGSVISDFLGSPNSDGFDVFIGLLRDGNRVFPLQYGKQFLELLKALIPAGLMPFLGSRETFHIYLLGEQIRDMFWPWYGGGTPPSILGFLYLNFHIPGIILGMFIFGILSRLLYLYLLTNLVNREVVLFYGLSLFDFITGMIRGGDLVVVGHQYIIKLLFVLIGLSIVNSGQPKRRCAR